MEQFNDITRQWDAVAQTDEAQGAIHPAGHLGEDAYEDSGLATAQMFAFSALDYLPAVTSPRVVDFGCGDGRVTQHLADMFDDVWGVDSSPSMLDRFEERVPQATPLLSNGVDGNMAGLEADIIMSAAVFIHHSLADGARLLEALTAAAAPGGVLALQIPCYEATRERTSWIDVTVWTEELLRDAAEGAGLEVLEVQTNPGPFTYDNVGPNHNLPQVLRRRR